MLDDDGGNHTKMLPPPSPIASAIAKTIRIRFESSKTASPVTSPVPNTIHKAANLITTAAQHFRGHERNNQHEKRHKYNTRTARVRTVVACV
jgi:hypothetical protein